MTAGENDKHDDLPGLRELARRGLLAAYVAAASAQERRRLRVEAYDLLLVLVFGQLTRNLELRRGHRGCARGVRHLADECLDRFHDDMNAVLDDLFANARIPIQNLEGWVRRRLTHATVDAYRRRRGERGALQRPRVPGWLAERLGGRADLAALAVEMLEWVGVEATAGAQDWPVDAWAQARAARTGEDLDKARRAVTEDVALVLTAMRGRPRWFADYVERPLGRKRPAPATGDADARSTEEGGHGGQDSLRDLAALAFAALELRLARGEEPRAAVSEVLRTVFAAGSGRESLDRLPGASAGADEWVLAQLADPAAVARITDAVLALLPGQPG
ncbi:hypothetical protein [Catellatospora bangladeshensis]|uniref:Uncharacterized protein n=1 Tax=Catellatospora bangladeshensis TaxID=310355 RepID=A0A8J3JN48_9ACTN|nr:hypothetical protein [Catellatospora bangladeshensis]GIF83707.1 hypothetical protein Cba03nite_50560 [Catellatospora bangladeshensis]